MRKWSFKFDESAGYDMCSGGYEIYCDDKEICVIDLKNFWEELTGNGEADHDEQYKIMHSESETVKKFAEFIVSACNAMENDV